jgi:uncharacterized protein YecT (DUF1311 family)
MLVRHLPKIALALVSVVACNTPNRDSAHDTSAARANADTTPVTTHEMVEALTREVKASERDLAASEDSVYVFIGNSDSTTVLLKRAHASWEQYRKLECDAIKVAFAEGSMAPVAQMECWIDLTDDHRKFIAQEYGYMRNGGPPPGRPPR